MHFYMFNSSNGQLSSMPVIPKHHSNCTADQLFFYWATFTSNCFKNTPAILLGCEAREFLCLGKKCRTVVKLAYVLIFQKPYLISHWKFYMFAFMWFLPIISSWLAHGSAQKSACLLDVFPCGILEHH